MPDAAGPRGPLLTRRRLLVSTAAVVGAGALGSVAGYGAVLGPARSSDPSGSNDALVPFDGAHQAGIVTPAQDRLAFAAFDLASSNRDDIVGLLRTWTMAARHVL